jgi:hypothetical protein
MRLYSLSGLRGDDAKHYQIRKITHTERQGSPYFYLAIGQILPVTGSFTNIL